METDKYIRILFASVFERAMNWKEQKCQTLRTGKYGWSMQGWALPVLRTLERSAPNSGQHHRRKEQLSSREHVLIFVHIHIYRYTQNTLRGHTSS